MAFPPNCKAVGEACSDSGTTVRTEVPFTTNPALTMHIDINSCFATLEQQANPLIRNRPVAVAASKGSFGCILASSYEAKALGIKTGTRVGEARAICPSLIVLEPDPNKYRHVHDELRLLLDQYSPVVIPKSIDEFIVDLRQGPQGQTLRATSLEIAREIKSRIKSEIGDAITVSIGIAPNRILAKLGADIDKPDGLQLIDHTNYKEVYDHIELTDFCGVSTRTKIRLNRAGIVTATQFAEASIQTLKFAFGSVLGKDWYYRLRGIEVDNWETTRRVFGNSYVIPKAVSHEEGKKILSKLASKSTRRLRAAGYTTSILGLYIAYGDHTSYHQSLNLTSPHFDTRDIYQGLLSLYNAAPHKDVKQLAESCSGLAVAITHPTLFGTVEKSRSLMASLDQVNQKYGDNTLHFACMSTNEEHVHDSIAFGH
jgi:DNA polymerase-4